MHPLFTVEETKSLEVLAYSGLSWSNRAGGPRTSGWMSRFPLGPPSPIFSGHSSFLLKLRWFRTSRAIWPLFTVEAVSSWGSLVLELRAGK